jgi:hypothetical protein
VPCERHGTPQYPAAFGNAFPEIKAPADAQVVDLEALA